jgi:hypothetical protein
MGLCKHVLAGMDRFFAIRLTVANVYLQSLCSYGLVTCDQLLTSCPANRLAAPRWVLVRLWKQDRHDIRVPVQTLLASSAVSALDRSKLDLILMTCTSSQLGVI